MPTGSGGSTAESAAAGQLLGQPVPTGAGGTNWPPRFSNQAVDSPAAAATRDSTYPMAPGSLTQPAMPASPTPRQVMRKVVGHTLVVSLAFSPAHTGLTLPR